MVSVNNNDLGADELTDKYRCIASKHRTILTYNNILTIGIL